MAIGLGLFLLIAIVASVGYAVRRGQEGSAFRNAEKLAQLGRPAEALRAVLDAEQHWGFNTAHDNSATRVAALDRLQSLVQLAAAQLQALGQPIDVTGIITTIGHLRHLLGTSQHYSWVDGSLKSEFKQHEGPLIMQLHAGREWLRGACRQVLAAPR